ncbi:hypothetical protein SAE02_62940 [Skermanella aerolata]|uniref:Uncharacterized protein n=2 Tax=Skermanella aerolata TaxID=393310 RepID=A0A512E080_9PROT|nr:hypothetical protein SAE02_62940 [Skermanella aerolata]
MPDPVFFTSLPHDLHAPLRMVADRLKTDPGFADALNAFLADDGSECDEPADLNDDPVPDIMVLDANNRLFVVLEGDWAQLVRVLAGLNSLPVDQGIRAALERYTATTLAQEAAGKVG